MPSCNCSVYRKRLGDPCPLCGRDPNAPTQRTFGATSAFKWPGGSVWHLEQIGGRTVCGLHVEPLPLGSRMCAAELEGDPGRCCKSCLRMKDASTVQLKPWGAL